MDHTTQAPLPPIPTASDLSFGDLSRALSAGWRDFLAQPLYGLFFASIYVAGGMVLGWLLMAKGDSAWLVVAASGFPLVAPFTAVGLYEVSRRREAGIALLALARHGSAGAPAPWWGWALLLGAVVCEASYVVIGKRLTGQVSPRRISALINLWGLALVTPLGLWQAYTFDFAAVTGATWALLVFYALAASMVSVWLWMKGLRHVPAPRAGVFTVMLPVAAALVGVLFLGEPFGVAHAVAFALALAGLLLATWPARR